MQNRYNIIQATLDRSHINVANIVVSPEDRQVPIRVMNSSEELIEVMKGQKIATFQQLTEIRSEEANASYGGAENFACGAALSDSFQSQVEVRILMKEVNVNLMRY